MSDTSDRLLTVSQVAERLQLNQETIRRWLRDGRLTGIDLGSDSGGWRIDPADLDAFIADRRGTRTTEQQKRTPR
jgi:excisionase family DNA binding protein